MDTEMLEFTTPDDPMRTFVATPDGPPRRGIVVVREAFGLGGGVSFLVAAERTLGAAA